MGICLIANPAAGNGRGARALPAALQAFAEVGEVVVKQTVCAGDEARLVGAALAEGHSTLAVLGGDGTWSKASSAVVSLGADCRMALLAAGTGNDLAKSVGVPAGDFGAMARLAWNGADRRIDVGRVDGVVFVNIAGFGFDASVLHDMQRLTWVRGTASYGVAAVRQLFSYPGFDAELSLPLAAAADAGVPVRSALRQRFLGVFVANGGYFGGAFHIAPDARVDDGMLDVISLGEAGAWRRMRLFAAAFSGSHVREPEVRSARAVEATLRFPAPPLFDADGELRQAAGRDVRIECIPAALRMVVAD